MQTVLCIHYEIYNGFHIDTDETVPLTQILMLKSWLLQPQDANAFRIQDFNKVTNLRDGSVA